MRIKKRFSGLLLSAGILPRIQKPIRIGITMIASSAAPAIDQARVAEVRQALESGSYRIDPAKIAERMLDLDKQLGG